MKRFLLILSPYLLFCLILSTLLFLRPRKIKIQDKITASDTTQVDSTEEVEDNTVTTIDSSNSESVDGELPVSPDEGSEQVTTQSTDIGENSVIIVVGSFKKETTATQLCEKLKPAGFNSRVEKKDGLYRVIAGDYITDQDAQTDFNTLKDIGFEPWISDK